MGQATEDLINGTVCTWCGTFFHDKERPDALIVHEFPVLCWDCWADAPVSMKDGLMRSEYPTL